MNFEFNVASWGAWNPQHLSKDDWVNNEVAPVFDDINASPVLSQFSKMQKRRFSRLTKLMLSAAFDCVGDLNYSAVFASRHGELTRTISLLEDIAQKESLSPIAFSQSVHNTGSGLFSILQKNTHVFTSIAAMNQTFAMAAAETYSQTVNLQKPVLLTFAQEPTPEIYQKFINDQQEVISVALLLSQKTATPGIKLALTNIMPKQKVDTIHYAQLIDAIAKEQELQGELEGWYWHVFKEL